jgi:hypothetical protein
MILADLCILWGKEQSMRCLIHGGLVCTPGLAAVYVICDLQGRTPSLGFLRAGWSVLSTTHAVLARLWAGYLML